MAKAARRKSSSASAGFRFRTNAPHHTTVIISVILFALAILGAILPMAPIIGVLGFWLALIGYLLLLAGCLMKGL
ncbi:MAG TPA: hypothetical protein VHD34_07050 [Xanthobacteraceae bacterium]|nr:hypothetical protein [Xanthobacteraceae bacterium]